MNDLTNHLRALAAGVIERKYCHSSEGLELAHAFLQASGSLDIAHRAVKELIDLQIGQSSPPDTDQASL